MNNEADVKKLMYWIKYLERLTEVKLSISNLILTIRECEGVSQAAFAKKLKITRQRLCEIEHGRSCISPKLAVVFSRKLGYSEAQFILV